MTHIQDILSQTATFVLAGGRGARLTPLTHKRSKPAVPFGDRRILDFALTNCLRSNLKHPSVITQYQGAHLTQHVGRWWLKQSASGAVATASPVCVPCPTREYLGTPDALFRNVQLLDPKTQSILMSGVVIGAGARVRRAILDENVRVQAGARLGYKTGESQGFSRTPNGVVVVPANSIIPVASGIYTAPRQRQIRLEPQPAR